MNIVFFGTPAFSKAFLASLYEDEDISVSAVVTQPDKPVGRKKVLTPPPVKAFARTHGIDVLQPQNMSDPAFLEALTSYRADVFVIVAYGKILPQAILDIPAHGNINVHPSKLPKWRGPSPIQAAIAAGDDETAVSIMLIDDKMDHGPILAQKPIAIEPTETPKTLHEKVVAEGAPLLIQSMKRFVSGALTPQEQNHEKATFCKLLKKEDGRIHWSKPAEVIERKIRAFTPWPGTWTTLQGNPVKIHAAELPNEDVALNAIAPGEIALNNRQLFVGTGTTPLRITQIQPAGKQQQQAKDFINGNQDLNGARFT